MDTGLSGVKDLSTLDSTPSNPLHGWNPLRRRTLYCRGRSFLTPLPLLPPVLPPWEFTMVLIDGRRGTTTQEPHLSYRPSPNPDLPLLSLYDYFFFFCGKSLPGAGTKTSHLLVVLVRLPKGPSGDDLGSSQGHSLVTTDLIPLPVRRVRPGSRGPPSPLPTRTTREGRGGGRSGGEEGRPGRGRTG